MKLKIIPIILLVALAFILGSCAPAAPGLTTPCTDRKALFCEDFEGIDPKLETSLLVDSTAFDQWWAASDDDGDYLFADFPQNGRTRTNLIVLGAGQYQDGSSSLLYTREIDLRSASEASLSYNLIYRTEKSWDGLIVFAVLDGVDGYQDSRNWIHLTPESGYPNRVLMNGVLIPGYSGISPGWIHQQIDLTEYAGSKLILGFFFTADEYENYWGAALDDIIVEADGGSIAADTAGFSDHSLGELVFEADPLISLDLPRANPLGDIPCLADKEEILLENQRAVIKATSQTENHYLVLHPDSGLLCWVNSEEVWIDGSTANLPRLVEKTVVSYAPIMPFSQTPTLIDSACGSGIQSDLPLKVDTAVIIDGLIEDIRFAPAFPGEENPPGFDPRIGGLGGEFFWGSSTPVRGGSIWLDQDGVSYSCQANIGHQQNGWVDCLDVSLEQQKVSRLDICWQGWDMTQACPPGFYLDPNSSACVPDDGSAVCEPACGPGYLLDPDLGICLIDQSPGTVVVDPNSCPTGYLYNPEADICVVTDSIKETDCSGLGCYHDYLIPETNCPQGLYYSLETGSCVVLEGDGSCPEGYKKGSEEGTCLPETSQAPIKCQAIDLNLPTLEVTVEKAARCLKDPGNPNDIVSSLDPFDKAEILGLGEDGETLVIMNPKYQIPCWAPLDSFYLDETVYFILPVISSE